MSNHRFTIRKTLRGHLLELEGLPRMSWENQPFEPDENAYIREQLMPADEFLSANNERTATGMYFLDLFVPVGSPISDAENLMETIKEHFRPAQVVGSVKIEKSVILQADSEESWYRIPLRIDYRSHQQNTGA